MASIPVVGKEKAPTSTFSQNKVNLYTALAVGGLALGLIALGVIVAAMGTSPKWYHDRPPLYDNPHIAPPDNIPFEVSNRHALYETFAYGAKVGAVALGPCIAGFAIFVLALIARYKEKNKPKEKSSEIAAQVPDLEGLALESSSKKWRNIALVLGFSIAVFSTGLMIASGDILHHGVSKMKDLIEQGRLQAPDAQSFNSYYRLSGHNFWDEIQSNWLNPTEHAMKGILPVGIFGALGGSGVVVAAVLGKGIFSCTAHLRSKFTEKKEGISTGEPL